MSEVMKIPRGIDDPPQVLLWTMDELIPPCMGLVLGMLLAQVWKLTALGFLASYLYRRFRDSKPDGYLRHRFYWFGLIPLKARSIPNPFQRIFYS